MDPESKPNTVQVMFVLHCIILAIVVTLTEASHGHQTRLSRQSGIDRHGAREGGGGGVQLLGENVTRMVLCPLSL